MKKNNDLKKPTGKGMSILIKYRYKKKGQTVNEKEL